ncbi:Uncharacterised protein [Salmonella enterica subsp. diarizonae]|uniref:Uncharacterized protein n=1 Tax=Salmonella diarizonae TaxID=59204 RepID=A0A379U296_SALDZ|nr:Uncharacterised protein [Salmonella enterica subsp. diarizonae]
MANRSPTDSLAQEAGSTRHAEKRSSRVANARRMSPAGKVRRPMACLTAAASSCVSFWLIQRNNIATRYGPATAPLARRLPPCLPYWFFATLPVKISFAPGFARHSRMPSASRGKLLLIKFRARRPLRVPGITAAENHNILHLLRTLPGGVVVFYRTQRWSATGCRP